MGGQKGIACFYEAFSKLLPVSLISTKNNDAPNNLAASFLPILSNTSSRYYNPFLIFSLRKITSKNNSTHLILEHPYLGWLGILAKLFFGIKLVIHSHNIESLRFKSTRKWWWKLLWYYEKCVHKRADINFFITDEDRDFAIVNFGLINEKCHTITYGFDFNAPPTFEEKKQAKSTLQTTYNIPADNKIILFNGTLDYKPNLDAVDSIINHINPELLKNENFHYTIIICGKNLPAHYNNLKNHRNIIYAGFVDDISLYFKGSDLFINPVIDGGGIKTKLVEALGNNLNCISTKEGAIGVPVSITGEKLTIVEGNDWQAFALSIINHKTNIEAISTPFFDHFYWGKIAEKAADVIKNSI
jgi:glycosyltransferase involved in cell wall biosynthesis